MKQVLGLAGEADLSLSLCSFAPINDIYFRQSIFHIVILINRKAGNSLKGKQKPGSFLWCISFCVCGFTVEIFQINFQMNKRSQIPCPASAAFGPLWNLAVLGLLTIFLRTRSSQPWKSKSSGFLTQTISRLRKGDVAETLRIKT